MRAGRAELEWKELAGIEPANNEDYGELAVRHIWVYGKEE
jgi:hypothetical protein